MLFHLNNEASAYDLRYSLIPPINSELTFIHLYGPHDDTTLDDEDDNDSLDIDEYFSDDYDELEIIDFIIP